MISLTLGTPQLRTAIEFTSSSNPYVNEVIVNYTHITWVITNTSIATVAWNTSTGVATFTPVALGQTIVTVTDTIAGLSTTDTVEVVPVVVPTAPVGIAIAPYTPP